MLLGTLLVSHRALFVTCDSVERLHDIQQPEIVWIAGQRERRTAEA
jgi:hypothetical protein